MKHFLLSALLAASVCAPAGIAQPVKKTSPKTLYSTIMAMDKQVFSAYNSCDLKKFDDYFTRDVEFFHDRTGRTESRHDLMKTMKALCESGGMYRELVSAKVYPLDFYGALEIGTHKFYKVVNGKRKFAWKAQFINVWKQDDDKWQIARVISYAHD